MSADADDPDDENDGESARDSYSHLIAASDKDLKKLLQSLNDYDFEYLVADLWERMGWTAEVSQASNDAGVDVTATKNSPYPQKTLIQAKRYGSNTSVGSPDVQQYSALKQQEPGVDSAVIVTTGAVSHQARGIATKLNVKLVDCDGLVAMIRRLDAFDLVYDRLPPDVQAAFTDDTDASTKSESADGSDADTDINSDTDTNIESESKSEIVVPPEYADQARADAKWVIDYLVHGPEGDDVRDAVELLAPVGELSRNQLSVDERCEIIEAAINEIEDEDADADVDTDTDDTVYSWPQFLWGRVGRWITAGRSIGEVRARGRRRIVGAGAVYVLGFTLILADVVYPLGATLSVVGMFSLPLLIIADHQALRNHPDGWDHDDVGMKRYALSVFLVPYLAPILVPAYLYFRSKALGQGQIGQRKTGGVRVVRSVSETGEEDSE